jgi:hypothetical protein
MKPRFLVCLLALLALVVLAGCGSSSSSSGSNGADPAKLAPAQAPIYLDAVVRPDGKLGDDANAALKKLLQTNDPGSKLVGLVDKALTKEGLTWDHDIKPWLGQRVGVFISSFDSNKKPIGAGIFDTTDTGKAKSTLDKIVGKGGATSKQTYKGVDLTVNSSRGLADAIVGNYALVGTPGGIEQAIDVSKGGRPITDVADFKAARSAVGADQALGTAYVQPKALVDAIAQVSSSAAGAQSAVALDLVRELIAKTGRALAAGLHADSDGIRIQAAELGSQPSTSTGTSGADELANLPGDAWLGIGFGDIGGSLTKVFANLQKLAALSSGGTSGIGSLFSQFEANTGINFQKDLLSWMGSGAIYGRGQSLTDLGLALTITSKNPAKSMHAVDLIANAVRKSGATVQDTTVEGYTKAKAIRLNGLPFPFVIAAGGNHFSLGLNPQAMSDMLHPSSKLSDSPQYAAATKALGSGIRPVFLLDTPTVVNLAEAFGASNSASFQKIQKYLDALGPIAVGIQHDGDTTKFALAVALK